MWKQLGIGDTEWKVLDLILKGTIAIVAGVWVLFVYNSEAAKDRQAKDEAERLRYVIPFMHASQDLQSRLYNILRKDGLNPLRDQYEDGAHAEELLYMIAQYNGWQSAAERYSSYGCDQNFIDYTSAIRGIFAADVSWDRPLRLFHPQQRNLGQMAVAYVPGSATPDFYAVPFSEFVRNFEQLKERDVPGHASLDEFLTTLKKATTVENLDGQSRLAEVQTCLVYLLKHLEEKEEIRIRGSNEPRYTAKQPPGSCNGLSAG